MRLFGYNLRSPLGRVSDPPLSNRQLEILSDEVQLQEGDIEGLRRERGTSGTTWSGYLPDFDWENNSLWQRPVLYDTVDKMVNTDAQVRATYMAIVLAVMQAKWVLEHSDARVLSLANDNLFQRIDWQDMLYHALTKLLYGHAWFEKTYMEDQGFWQIRKMAVRTARSVESFRKNDHDEMTAVVQNTTAAFVTIPAPKIVWHVFQPEGSNFFGRSMFRSAYGHWYMKTQLYRLDVIAQERAGIGVPIITMPENREITADDVTRAKDIGRNYRGHEKAYAVLPAGWGFRVEYGQQGRDPMPTIEHHDEMIARNSLATFLNLGMTRSGSRALATSSIDFFLMGVHAVAEDIASIVKTQFLRQLVRLNFPEGVKPPELIVGRIRRADFASIARGLAQLADKGFIQPDEYLENHIRDIFDLPRKATGTGHEVRPSPSTPSAPAGLTEALASSEVAIDCAVDKALKDTRKTRNAIADREEGIHLSEDWVLGELARELLPTVSVVREMGRADAVRVIGVGSRAVIGKARVLTEATVGVAASYIEMLERGVPAGLLVASDYGVVASEEEDPKVLERRKRRAYGDVLFGRRLHPVLAMAYRAGWMDIVSSHAPVHFAQVRGEGGACVSCSQLGQNPVIPVDDFSSVEADCACQSLWVPVPTIPPLS